MPGQPKSFEMFLIDKSGRCTDVHLHEQILSGIDPADARPTAETRKRVAERYGWPSEVITKVYG